MLTVILAIRSLDIYHLPSLHLCHTSLLNIISIASQWNTNKALDQHLLTAGVREVKCGAEGQPLVTNFSQRKYWSRDGKQEPSQASAGKT